ncbi:hypothetical protein ACRE_060800 [Hapsidospora chrysogenum ATCC 11550]|uniref:Uncharacterized protein n=1 Tax=Hapsidospora chrysogenum (strain ATCC 11550 / CBS 779.69 / DSM 880 / IAM 14645 / JCM 23072 / IMI 49137) TaxID=857340 RepID=A0A086T1B1_HAPC1|nr:hypothetical protein ACRE_060800 [Hapsidospora chrysogenum ATCC 11550]
MHYQGVTYAATPGAIMCVTQLYYALRQEGLLPEDLVWEDLDTFISMQGSEAFFVGNQPPTDREGHYKNFIISLGISTSSWAPPKRKNKKANIHAGTRRNMKFMAFTSLKTNNRIVSSAGDQPPSTAEVIQNVLQSGRRHALLDGKGHVRPGMKTKAPEAASFWPDEHTPAGLIRTLAEDINAEVADLDFDIFTLHNKTWDLLQRMRDHTRELYDQLPLIVGYVLATAAGRIDVNAGPPQAQRDDLLLVAGRIMRQFLEEGHGRVVKDLAAKDLNIHKRVEDLEFEDDDPSAINYMKRKIDKQSLTGPICPVQ